MAISATKERLHLAPEEEQSPHREVLEHPGKLYRTQRGLQWETESALPGAWAQEVWVGQCDLEDDHLLLLCIICSHW